MEKYAVSDLVKEVKVILDRNQETAEMVPGDTDTLSQGEIIRGVIVDAAKTIERNAAGSLLDGITYHSAKATWTLMNGAYVGYITLPSNLMRVDMVKVSDWERSTFVASEGDDRYKMQGNRWVRGNVQNPFAVLVHYKGELALELYTSNSSDATVDFSYVPTPSIDSDGNIELCSKLKDAIVYMAASLACISLGDTESAASYKSTAYELAGIVEPSQT